MARINIFLWMVGDTRKGSYKKIQTKGIGKTGCPGHIIGGNGENYNKQFSKTQNYFSTNSRKIQLKFYES